MTGREPSFAALAVLFFAGAGLAAAGASQGPTRLGVAAAVVGAFLVLFSAFYVLEAALTNRHRGAELI